VLCLPCREDTVRGYAHIDLLVIDEAEARLLLSIDRLASLAQTQDQLRDRLLEITPVDCAELEAAWQAAAEGVLSEAKPRRPIPAIPEQFLVLVTCPDERSQVELLARFQSEGLDCRALVS
jgi:hypothetical protein